MLKVFGISTTQIDDIDDALNEIDKGIAENGLYKNSAGIITCHADYIEEGVTAALSKHLGFPIVGITVKTSANMDELSEFMLTLTIFTSDSAEFVPALTNSVTADSGEDIKNTYLTAANGRKPALTFIFPGLLTPVSGDFYINALSEVAADVPLFGALSVDHTADYGKSRVIYGEESYPDRAAFLLVFGEDVRPKFFLGTLPVNIINREKAEVTSADGSLLKTINNISARDYFASVGINENADGTLVGLNMCTLSVDIGDGTPPFIRAIFSTMPDGSVACGGDIPIGAKISIAYIETSDIVESDKELVKAEFPTVDSSEFLLMFSCVGRFFILGYNSNAEMELFKNAEPKALPFAMSYCGGEICPVKNRSGKLINRAHNHTIIGVAL
ncbi:MAG: FIST C-terminal domain-containing protein [Ruminococcus sp.]|jgi:hypothetical protein|nr:FIST C-terminal domain-containing protein [Ruminococcus sp.]